MKNQSKYIIKSKVLKLAAFSSAFLLMMGITSCQKLTDVVPESNEVASNYYRNYNEVNIALTGCYNGLQEPLLTEWMLTELRSDNARQRSATSTTNVNQELNVLNLYTVSPQHQQVYNYWLSVYKNIRNINYVLRSLGVSYSNDQLVYGDPTADVTEAQRDELIGQALFLRAYHYFNLVRLFGGVFIISEPILSSEAKNVNRSTVQECYNFIISDLQAASTKASSNSFAQISPENLGKANSWSAKALLAKVYLTIEVPRTGDALTLLDDIIAYSGYGLESDYARIFSINNEMNKEILFTVRYKSGLVGLGNPMANSFAPASSGDAVINGDGSGFNYPTISIFNAYRTPFSGAVDKRKAATIGVYTSSTPYYINKFLSKVAVKNDAENDFPVIRYADVLLMKAEALDYSDASIELINEIRQRAGAVDYTSGNFNSAFYKYPLSGTSSIDNASDFKAALLNERRLEFAFENQRFFDMVRFGEAINVMHNHYTQDYQDHYRRYRPVITIDELKENVTEEKLLLPIPQREIDTNTQIQIIQNPGY